MAVSKLAGGFVCEFKEKLNEAFQTECLICLLILREPYQVICCGKSYCRSCIECVKALKKPCPHCNKRNFNDFPNKGLQQSLHKMTVYCTHQKEGCKWTGELGELDNHLNLDPQPDNKLKGCVFVMVECTQCSESHQRQHINHHQTEECPKRPFTCEHCKFYTSSFEWITTNHWPVCGCYPVECSNKCGAVLQRQNLESHVAKHCPLTVIECDFHYAGCEVKLPRKDMGEHLRVELVKHTSMMTASRNIDLQKLVELTTKQMLLLATENTTLKQKVSELEREQKRDRALIKIAHDNTIPVFIMMQFLAFHDTWYSPPFYTHQRGYKLCLQCKKNTHSRPYDFSVYVHLMQGEYDNEQTWPLKGELPITVLRQDGSNENFMINFQLSNHGRVSKGVRSQVTNGFLRLFSIDECYKHYIDYNGNLHFKIESFFP